MAGDRDRVILAEIIARCWSDARFQGEFLHDPKTKLREAGMPVPDPTKVHVFRSDTSVTYLGLSHTMKPEEYLQFAGEHVKSLLPLGAHHEVRIVQSTPDYLPIIIPVPPKTYLSGELSDQDLAEVAGGGWVWEVTNVATTVEAAAEQAGVAVTTAAGAAEAVAAAVAAAVIAVVLI